MAYENLEFLINGKWTKGTADYYEPVFNPVNGDVLGQVPHAHENDLNQALEASARGFEIWRKTPPIQRQIIINKTADILTDRKQNIAENLTREMGKPLSESLMEIGVAIDTLRWFGEEGKRAYGRIIAPRDPSVSQAVIKEPIGPVVAFTAWNFPAVNVMRKVSAALAAGCSITIKPSEETPATAVAIGRAFMDAGLPDGVLNIVFGVPAKVSEYLLSSSIPKKLSFTGSIPIGKHLQRLASNTLKRCTLELGGHAPCIVFKDANIKRAAEMAAAGKFRNAGQVCVAASRFYVEEGAVKEFTEHFVAATKAIKIGNGLDNDVQMGPLLAERRIPVMERFVKDACNKGAKLLCGGERIGNEGHFFAATVLGNVSEDAAIMNEEPFGPVAPISSFKTFDEVVSRANKMPVGLSAYAFTSDPNKTMALRNEIETGMLAINSMMVHVPETPFGGVNESGYGSEGSIEGLEVYLRTKFISETFLPV